MKKIKKHLPEIEKYFFENSNNFTYTIKSIKIDYVYRIYTVLNFKEIATKNINTYGHSFLDNETYKFIYELNKQLKKIGLYELVGLERADKIGDNNILIVVKFKLLNIEKIFKYLISFLMFIIIISGIFIFI